MYRTFNMIKGGNARSCTYVVTEYRCAFPGQILDFAATLHYASTDEMVVMLAEQLKNYRAWICTDKDDWDDELRVECKLSYDTAIQTFMSLFCHKPEFGSLETGAHFLSTEEDDKVIQIFLKWCEEHLETKPRSDGQTVYDYVESETAAALRARIDPDVSASLNYTQPAIWPLLSRVR